MWSHKNVGFFFSWSHWEQLVASRTSNFFFGRRFWDTHSCLVGYLATLSMAGAFIVFRLQRIYIDKDVVFFLFSLFSHQMT